MKVAFTFSDGLTCVNMVNICGGVDAVSAVLDRQGGEKL